MRSEMLDRRERHISGFYEANEQPKNCPNCNSTVSRITHTYRCGNVNWRYRICVLCNRKFKSQSIVSFVPKSVENIMM